MERGDKHGPRLDDALAGELVGGTPDGMTAADVEGRAELARFLRPSAFPGTAGELLAVARDEGATDRVLAELGRLRSGSGGGDRRFDNVQDVWRALGHGVETRRN